MLSFFCVVGLKITNLSAFTDEKYSLSSLQSVFLKHSAKLEYLSIFSCLNSWKGWSVLLMSSSKSVGLSCVSVSSSTSDSKIRVSCFWSILCFQRDVIFRRVITMHWLFSKVLSVWLCEWLMSRDASLSLWYSFCTRGSALICLLYIFPRMWNPDKEVARLSATYACP